MVYSDFPYCRHLKKELLKLEEKKQKHYKNRNYEKQKLAEQTFIEAKTKYKNVAQEIENWLKVSTLAPKYKKSCVEYYIKGNAKIENLEREIKNCLGEE